MYPLAEYFVDIDFISDMPNIFLTLSRSVDTKNVGIRNELDFFKPLLTVFQSKDTFSVSNIFRLCVCVCLE